MTAAGAAPAPALVDRARRVMAAAVDSPQGLAAYYVAVDVRRLCEAVCFAGRQDLQAITEALLGRLEEEASGAQPFDTSLAEDVDCALAKLR